MQIYIHRNNQQFGPFTEDEIKAQLAAGTISPQDHVWWQGLANWMPLSQSPLVATLAPSATGTPVVPYPNATVPTTSKLAIWALVCGCLSLLLGLLTSIPAIILGHLGLSKIKKNPVLQGRSMALAGLIIGYSITSLMILIPVVAISVLLALGNQVKGTFKTINVQSNAAQMQNSQDNTDNNQTTNSPDQSTNSPDSSTNSTPTITP